MPGQAALPGSSPSHAGLPSAASVGRAMLTAFNGVTGDIEYTTETGITKGVTVDVYRAWSWPAAPAPGQRQVERTLFSQRTPQVPALTVTEDNAVAYTTPRAGVRACGAGSPWSAIRGTGQTGCAWARCKPSPEPGHGQPEVWVSASDIDGGWRAQSRRT